MKKKNLKIAIVGAGVTGLVAGYELSKKGHRVTIYEKSDDIGGLMGGFKIGNTSLEKAYHHIFSTDKYIIDLIKELGLENKLKFYPESMAIYYQNRIYPFMGAVDLLKFKPLDIISKVRLGIVKIWLEKDNNFEKYKNILAYKWMKKWCGTRAYTVIWEPLLKGKFGERYKDISMAWLWARIHTRGNSGKLGYLTGGFKQIADELSKRILVNSGKILLNYEFKISNYEMKKFDKILYTGAAKNIDYLGAINVVFTSKQNLSSYYWHNINDPRSPFLAFIQHTSLVDKKYYGDKHVYYLGTYLPNDDKLMQTDDKTIKKIYFDYLKKIKTDFDEKQIDESWVYKFKNAQHIVTTNYQIPPSILNPPLTPPLTGRGATIYQAKFAQIFPEDRGTNFAVREGEKVAKLMLTNTR